MNLESHLPLVLDLALKSSAILLAAFAISCAARKISAARRHLIWLAVFITLTFLPLTLAIPPRWSWSWENSAEPAQTIHILPEMREAPPAETNPVAAGKSLKPSLPGWPAITGSIWLAGMLLLLSRQAFGFWKLRELRARSRATISDRVLALAAELGGNATVELRESESCAVPLTWGFRHPVVMLPAASKQWSRQELRAALTHEFAHITRRDFLWRQLAQIVRAFYWPTPLVWFAVRALHRTQEQSCDDLVLHHGARPDEYAMQLLQTARSLAANAFTSTQAVAMALPSTLEGRVRAIVDTRRDRRAPGRWTRMSAATTIIAAIAGSAFAQLKAKPPVPAGRPQQIAIEMKVVEAQDGALGLSLKKGGEQVRRVTPAQLQADMETLAQTKGVDLLSAPKVITNAGQRAIVEIGNDDQKTGIKINVLPEIVDEEIRLNLIFEYKRVVNGSAQSKDETDLKISKLTKTVSVKGGDTVLLGGMATENGRSIVLTLTPSKSDREFPGKAAAAAPEGFDENVPTPADKTPLPEIADLDPAHPVSKRSRAILIPKLILQDATVAEAVDFLRAKAKEVSADGKGVDIVLKNSAMSEGARVSLNLTNIPLDEALKYIAALADLRLSTTQTAFYIHPDNAAPIPGAPQTRSETKLVEPPTTDPAAAPETALPVTINAEFFRTDDGVSFAEGNVMITHGNTRITGGKMRYDPAKREIEVTGSAQIEIRGNVTTCEKIIYHLDLANFQTEGLAKTVIAPEKTGR